MQSLYEKLPYSVEYKGKVYRINPYFDKVLHVFALFSDKAFSDFERITLVCSILVQGKVRLKHLEKCELVNLICNTLVTVKGHSANNVKCFDFLQDSQYIYSSFVYDYGIDLFDEQCKLHWWKFISLFNSLSESSKMSNIIHIRLKPIPPADKYNAKEIESLIKAKQSYALEFTQEEREAQLVSGLNNVKNTLLSLVKGG